MSKETAVEWLHMKLDVYLELFPSEWQKLNEAIEQAKAMERDRMLELISFVRVHNKMGKTAEDLLQQFEAYKGGDNE